MKRGHECGTNVDLVPQHEALKAGVGGLDRASAGLYVMAKAYAKELAQCISEYSDPEKGRLHVTSGIWSTLGPPPVIKATCRFEAMSATSNTHASK
jgi:hypothetical protein